MYLSRIIFVAITAFLFTPTVFGNAPAWLKTAAGYSVPQYDKDIPGVVLHDEEMVTLGTDGKLITTENNAIRLLDNSGRSLAVARAYYLVSSGKVRSIEAWLIKRSGTVRTYDKKTILDVIADADDIYNEGRLKIIDASRDAEPGDIFGYTVVSEDQPLFFQDIWQFQSRLPTLVSRYSLTLPQGWSATSITFNHNNVEPKVSGNNYVWELRDLKPIKPEPMSPSVIHLAPRISVNYSPNLNNNSVNRTFANWIDVSKWATTLHDPQVIINDAIRNKTRELTANAKTEFEKITAIGHFVQNLQYISVDIGVGYGNGYKPRASDLVLNRGYGDCKDKANLMRAMLKTINIDAYPIAIYSGDSQFVRAEWASPRQFNHCIIAVKISAETDAPTVLNHEKLGRLLIFDATDPYTPVGDLPDSLQGSNALIIAGDEGGLAEMPITPASSDLLERKIIADLTETGGLSGTISEAAKGQTSTIFRSEVRQMSAADFKRAIEGWLTRGASGAKLIDLATNDRIGETAFDLDIKFETPRYAQVMQNRLLVFKPVVVARRNAISLTEPDRQNPIRLSGQMMSESAEFTLPANFEIDEMPESVSIETPFGSYTTSYEAKEGKIFFSRKLVTNRMFVPRENYAQVRDFFSKMLEAEQSAIVLIRK